MGRCNRSRLGLVAGRLSRGISPFHEQRQRHHRPGGNPPLSSDLGVWEGLGRPGQAGNYRRAREGLKNPGTGLWKRQDRTEEGPWERPREGPAPGAVEGPGEAPVPGHLHRPQSPPGGGSRAQPPRGTGPRPPPLTIGPPAGAAEGDTDPATFLQFTGILLDT